MPVSPKKAERNHDELGIIAMPIQEGGKAMMPKTLDRVVLIDFHVRREMAGLTRRELAEITGLSQALIYRLEKGERVPSLGALCSLVDVLGPLKYRYRDQAYRTTRLLVIEDDKGAEGI